MKNLLKTALIALPLLYCLPSYGHAVCVEWSRDNHSHQEDDLMSDSRPANWPNRVCHKSDATAEVWRRLNPIRIIGVRYYSNRGHFRVTLIDDKGVRKTVTVDLACDDQNPTSAVIHD